jgi:hypothetical protein
VPTNQRYASGTLNCNEDLLSFDITWYHAVSRAHCPKIVPDRRFAAGMNGRGCRLLPPYVRRFRPLLTGHAAPSEARTEALVVNQEWLWRNVSAECVWLIKKQQTVRGR